MNEHRAFSDDDLYTMSDDRPGVEALRSHDPLLIAESFLPLLRWQPAAAFAAE
jgi:hypothetical protein